MFRFAPHKYLLLINNDEEEVVEDEEEVEVEVSNVSYVHDGNKFINRLSPDPRERHSMWACVFGGCAMWLVNCFNQSSVQRIGSLKTLKAAKM